MKIKTPKLKTTFLLACILSPLLIANSAAAKDLDKKELKKYKKSYASAAGNKAKAVFGDGKKIAVLGNSLVFRLEAKQTEQTSNKSKTWTKFSATAHLKGIDDSVFQEITEEYNRMYVERLKKMGMTVIPIEQAEKAKSFKSLIGEGKKSVGKGTRESKKNWGVSKTFTPKQQYAFWFNHFKPFGPHRKVPKEIKGSIVNAFTHIHFADIGVDISDSTVYGQFRDTTFTSGKSSIVPQVFIDRGSLIIASNGKKNFDIAVSGTDKSFDKLKIASDKPYANSAKECPTCKNGFEEKSFIQNTSIQTVAVDADPEKYKAAVLDALSNYLDVIFALYES